MLTSEKIKEMAKEAGADIVGIASMDRFEGLPKEMDPRQIFPEAKSMIVLGFRILRGCFRGIEEGTWFTTFSLMGYGGIRWVFQPICLWKFTKIIENEGYEAVPIVDNFPWTNIDNLDPEFIGQDFINVNRTMYGEIEKYKGKWSKPVSVEKPAPDIFVPMKICAYLAGLGEIGYSGMFLTPEFGPRQRLAAIITDAPLEPDPLVEPGTICDRCMECVKECPAGAISEKEKVKIKIAGKEIEWGKVDFRKCSVAFHGGTKEFNPFIVTEEDERGFNEQPYTKSMFYKLSPILFDNRGIGGMRGCQIACFIHLEEKGKIKNIFKRPFRTKKPWKMK
ncbi:epoxyqueuosine reductase [bacterium]|nr:epoxyqueuosine reductase [bacterium]